MAIFQTSALISAIRNSVGGVTFTEGPFGPAIREKVTPTNPNTSRQTTVRSAFTAAAVAWKSLTAAQRSAWTVYASGINRTNALGNPITLLGLNAFIAVNTLLQQAGQSIRSAGPSVAGLSGSAQYNGTNIVVSEAGQTIATDPGDIADAFDNYLGNVDDLDLAVYMGQGRTTSVNFYGGPYRLAGVVSGNTSVPVTSLSFTVPFPVTAGQIVRTRFVVINGVTGQMVSEDVADLTVAA